mgnify:CR=1 FL=1
MLRLVVKNIREEIKRLGGEVRFHTLVEDLRVEDGRVSGVICAQDGAVRNLTGAPKELIELF